MTEEERRIQEEALTFAKANANKVAIAKRQAPAHTSGEFSRFFREASSREKKKVYMDVARKASADQQKLLDQVRLKAS